jgi:pimeloyl-ACP methyl ester carboxylesterase
VATPLPDLPNARHREIPIDRASLHVAELGPQDGPPVLMVHGWPQNWWCWSGVAPLLASEFRCVMPDLPGFGWSTAPADGYAKERLADSLLRLLDHLEIERVRYVGHDWGAFLGLLIGIREPVRLSDLFALSIPHLWPSLRDRVNPIQLAAFAYQLPLSTPVVGAQLMRGGLTRRILSAANAGFSAEDVEIYESTMGSGGGATATTSMYRSFLTHDLPRVALGRYRHATLTVPTRLIVGERDPITRFNSLAGFETHAPRMRVERVPGAGHFLPQERPRLIAERVKASLSSRRATSRPMAPAT